MISNTRVVVALVLGMMAAAGAVAGPVQITGANFQSEVKDSGKNAFIKFFAPWCGHCKAMAPAWNQLGDAYEGSSSVVIGDADCTVESELCQKVGANGYPTIKYFTAESEENGDSYSGGRGFDELNKFVKDKLERLCDVDAPADCTEKEVSFLEKIKAKAASVKSVVQDQLKRLEGMKASKMKASLKGWVNQRINILKQLVKKDSKEEL